MDETPISLLSRASLPPANASIRGIVTLIWPYASSTQQCAFLLAHPDFRLRNRRGQVRVRFTGECAQQVARSHVGIGDEVVLQLEGASWAEDVTQGLTPGKGVDGELVFGGMLRLKVRGEDGEKEVRVEGVGESIRREENVTPKMAKRMRVAARVVKEVERSMSVYASPAFVKRIRLSGDPFVDSAYDPFNDGLDVDGEDGEDRRSSFGKVRRWRLAGQSPSPVPSDISMEDPREVENGMLTTDCELQAAQVTILPPEDGTVEYPELPTGSRPPISTLRTVKDTTLADENDAAIEYPQLPELPASPELLPPDAPVEVIEISASDSSQAVIQNEPSTPNLKPVPSSNLPLPSPFVAIDPMYGSLDAAGASLQSSSLRGPTPAVPPFVHDTFKDASGETPDIRTDLSQRAHESPTYWNPGPTATDQALELMEKSFDAEPLAGRTMSVSGEEEVASHAQKHVDAPRSAPHASTSTSVSRASAPYEFDELYDISDDETGPLERKARMSLQQEATPAEHEWSVARGGMRTAEAVALQLSPLSDLEIPEAPTTNKLVAPSSIAAEDNRMERTFKSLFGFNSQQPADPLPSFGTSEPQRDSFGRAADLFEPKESAELRESDLGREQDLTIELESSGFQAPEDNIDSESLVTVIETAPGIEAAHYMLDDAINTDPLVEVQPQGSSKLRASLEAPITISSDTQVLGVDGQDDPMDLMGLPIVDKSPSVRPLQQNDFAEMPGDQYSVPDINSLESEHIDSNDVFMSTMRSLPGMNILNSEDERDRRRRSRHDESYEPFAEAIQARKGVNTPLAFNRGALAAESTEIATPTAAAPKLRTSMDLNATTPGVLDLEGGSPSSPFKRTRQHQHPSPTIPNSESTFEEVRSSTSPIPETDSRHMLENLHGHQQMVKTDDEVMSHRDQSQTPRPESPAPSLPTPQPRAKEQLTASLRFDPSTEAALDIPRQQRAISISSDLSSIESPETPDAGPLLDTAVDDGTMARDRPTSRDPSTQEDEMRRFVLEHSAAGALPTPQPTQPEASQTFSSQTTTRITRGKTQAQPFNTPVKTPARKSRASRVSAIPTALSAWFTPKSSRVESPETTTPPDEGAEEVVAPFASQPSPAKLSKGFNTSLSYYTSLAGLERLVNASSQLASGNNGVDVLAVVTGRSKAPARAKSGPRDYFTVFHVTDASLGVGRSTQVEVFRPWKAKLPVAEVGDVVLLRSFAVKSRRRHPYLLSGDASAYCVWRFSVARTAENGNGHVPTWARKESDDVREEVKGPPVEFGEEEQDRVRELRKWWLRHVDGDDEEGHNVPGEAAQELTARL